MMFSQKFIKKANQFRKQNWSAPTIMSVFIIVCMIIVHSFETIGILNKEKNLDFRINTPEQIQINPNERLVLNDVISEKNMIDQLKILTEKNREDNLEQMMKILIDGANEQLLFSQVEGESNEVFDYLSSNADASDEIDFFDI